MLRTMSARSLRLERFRRALHLPATTNSSVQTERRRPHQPKPFSGSGAVLQAQSKSIYFATVTFSVELCTDPRLTFVGSIVNVICHSDLFAESVKLSVTLNCPVKPSADGELNNMQFAWPLFSGTAPLNFTDPPATE